MNHTKEPWKAVTGGRCDPEVIITTQDRIDNHKGEICGMDVEFSGPHGDEQKANARRIVTCVNALAGVETDYLEKYGLPDFAQKISDLTEQRDKLLDALNLLYSWANNGDSEFMNDPDWINGDYPKIQEAIAYTKE